MAPCDGAGGAGAEVVVVTRPRFEATVVLSAWAGARGELRGVRSRLGVPGSAGVAWALAERRSATRTVRRWAEAMAHKAWRVQRAAGGGCEKK